MAEALLGPLLYLLYGLDNNRTWKLKCVFYVFTNLKTFLKSSFLLLFCLLSTLSTSFFFSEKYGGYEESNRDGVAHLDS